MKSFEIGVSRRAADEMVSRGDLTWGDLRERIRFEQSFVASDRASVVNPGVTHDHAVGIFAAAIVDRSDGDIVCGPSCHRPLLDRLFAVNVLRECGTSRAGG